MSDKFNPQFPDNLDSLGSYTEERIGEGIETLKQSGIEIYLVRHGQSTANLNQELNRPDEYLTEKGEIEAKALGITLASRGLDFDLILVSPFRRAVHTAMIVSDCINTEYDPIVHKLLEERDFISMAGVKYDDIPEWAAHVGPNNLLKVGSANYIVEGHGIETFDALRKRAGVVLAHLGENINSLSGNNGRIMLVCHGDIAQMIIGQWIDIDFVTSLTKYRMPNAGGFVLTGSSEYGIKTIVLNEQ